MRGLGNYSFPRVERKPGMLVLYKGERAVVRFHNGVTFAIPAEPLRRLGLESGERFLMVIARNGKKIQEVRVESHPEARPARERKATPKVYLKDGKRTVTRK